MFSKWDEAIGSVLLILFFFDGGKAHEFVELIDLINLKFWYALWLFNIKIFISETAVHSRRSLCLLLKARRTAVKGVAEDGFDIHKN